MHESPYQIVPTWGYLGMDYWTFYRLATGGRWCPHGNDRSMASCLLCRHAEQEAFRLVRTLERKGYVSPQATATQHQAST